MLVTHDPIRTSRLVVGECGLQAITPRNSVIRPGASIAGAFGQNSIQRNSLSGRRKSMEMIVKQFGLLAAVAVYATLVLLPCFTLRSRPGCASCRSFQHARRVASSSFERNRRSAT